MSTPIQISSFFSLKSLSRESLGDPTYLITNLREYIYPVMFVRRFYILADLEKANTLLKIRSA